MSDTISHWWKYRWVVSVSILQRWCILLLLSLTLFMVFITHRYMDKLCLSVYSKSDGNCSLSPWHSSWCSLHMGILMDITHRYIPEAMIPINGLIFFNEITDETMNSNALTINARNYWVTRLLQVSQQNHRRNGNSNVLIINAFFIVDCVLCYRWNNWWN